MQLRRIQPSRFGLVAALAAALCAAAPAAAQVQPDSAARSVQSPPLHRSLLEPLPDAHGLFVGYRRITPTPVPLGGRRLAERRFETHWSDLSGQWWQNVEARLDAARDSLWRDGHGLLVRPGQRPRRRIDLAADTVRYLPVEEEPDTTPTLESFLPGGMGQYADLGMLVTGRGEMGSAWQRFEPCDATGFNTCEQGLRPRLRPDLQFGVLLGGTVTDRVHVAVDYDQTREFDAANNINVYYQGLEDEILQRFEMGDVSITMPQSQFLTGGVPGGNFGFRALAQVGPLEVQSVWAQQQGDIGSLEMNVDARTGSQYSDNRITLDDHAYVSGRFFFVVDPTQLPRYPHVDALALESAGGGSARPQPGTLQLYRDEQLPAMQHEASRVFLGRAVSPSGEHVVPGHFRRLDPNDYVVHSSGLWLMLRQPLGRDEVLAMSYVTEAGDTVGTMDATAEADATIESSPVLRLLRGPVADHHPAAETWPYEMHQVYQVYSGELDPRDLELQIKLGDASQGQSFVTHEGAQIQLLRLFGVDVQAPEDRLDPDFVFRPSEHQAGTQVSGTFLVFPTLRPFADPPPTPGLSASEADEALGSEANHRIYEERDPDLRASARFRLLLDYRVRTDGLVSEFSLGGFGVREGSERIQVDGVTLTRGTDYTVDYATGTVRLSNPQQLFAGRTSPRLSATFEQNSLFQIATKSIFGTTARWRVGQLGEVNLVGLYQNERSVMTRPELGNEPNSIMMGGLTTNLRFETNWMDRALDAIPGLRLAGESSIGVTGEVAMSLPDPNTRGLAYLDDFEATAEIRIGMSEHAWRLGSRPGLGDAGTGGWLPVMDASNVFHLVWQHQAFDLNGATFGAFSTAAVDTMIATVGRDIPEPVLYVSMREDTTTTPRGKRVWRSMTTVLSARGTDLTTSEFLEFYAQENSDDVAIVLDIGTVSEDAFFVDSLRQVTGLHPVTGEEWGLGILDQEAGFNQPWGTDLDFGIWDQGCSTTPGALSVLGSRHANCTVGNGRNDTEDLNGDGVPDLEDGAYFRYTVPLGPGSPYLVRDQGDTGTPFRLYRIPLRGPNALPLNGADGDTWRHIRHMRMTLSSGACAGEIPPGRAGAGRPLCNEGLLFSRMRFTGARWRKREVEGVIAGLVGREPVPGDHSMNVHLGPVSVLTDGHAYLGPPGAGNEASDPSASFGGTGVEVNEKALRIAVTDLEPDARAEVFYRFPQDTRSFMQYRQMRLWALPRAGDWGPDGTLSLLVKVGTDDGNYYLHRTRLRPPVENRNVDSRGYWLPEIVVDFEEWFRLKGAAEIAAVQAGVGDTAIWNADSTYAIVLSSRAQSPNLAAIRELTLAIHNGGGLPADSAELWVNDLRLGDGIRDAGFAGVVAIDARAADFATVRMSVANQGAFFHPMNRDATLEGSQQIGVSGRFEAGHFAPAGWGLAMPVTVQHNRQDLAPAFLARSDIRASDLDGLRESGSSTTVVGVSAAKTTPAANRWLGLLIDGARLSLNWRNASRNAFTQSNETSNFSGAVDYQHALQPRLIDVTPGFVVDLLRALAPAAIEGSGFFQRVSTASLRWSPSTIGFSTSYLDRDSKSYNYGTVLSGPGDAGIRPIESPERDLQNSASVGFGPFESLSAQLSLRSARDLLSAHHLDDPIAQRAVRDEIAAPGGFDLGWEKNRAMTSLVTFQPRIAQWLRPSLTWSSEYTTERTPHYLSIVEVGGDSIGTMQRDFGVDARLERRIHFDPGGLAVALWGHEPAAELGLARRALHRAGRAILPIDFTWSVERASRFDRGIGEPDYGYRFGIGELDRLRLVSGDTAGTASERVGFQVRGGTRLPFGLQLDLTYVDNDRHTVSGQGGNNDLSDRTWPDVRLGVSALPLPAFTRSVLARASVSTGYRIEESRQAFGNALRTRSNRSIPVQGAVTFANGLTATYTGSFGRARGLDTTGRTRGTDAIHGIQVRATFEPPEALAPRFDQPMTASLGFNYGARRLCDVSGLTGSLGTGDAAADSAGVRCAPRYDSLDRDVHFTLETMLDDLNLGMQFSLNDRKSFVGLRDGAREFRLAIFANFNFGVGVLPAGLGQGRFGY